MHCDSNNIIHDFSSTIFSVSAGVMIGENDQRAVLCQSELLQTY